MAESTAGEAGRARMQRVTEAWTRSWGHVLPPMGNQCRAGSKCVFWLSILNHGQWIPCNAYRVHEPCNETHFSPGTGKRKTDPSTGIFRASQTVASEPHKQVKFKVRDEGWDTFAGLWTCRSCLLHGTSSNLFFCNATVTVLGPWNFHLKFENQLVSFYQINFCIHEDYIECKD